MECLLSTLSGFEYKDNKFSVSEQWAELYNDEQLRLALEETMSHK